MAEQGLAGKLCGEEIVPILVDSITAIQVFNRNYRWLSGAVVLAPFVGLFVAMIASMDSILILGS